MAGYYVRFRGQITGPFDSSEVQRLYTRELLTPAHEVSPDRQTWRPLGADGGGISLADTEEGEAGQGEATTDRPEAASEWSALLAGDERDGSTPSIATPSALAAEPAKLAQVTAVSCGVLLLYTACLPVAWEEGPRFWWDGGALPVAVGALTMLLACGAIASAAPPDAAWRGSSMMGLGGAGMLLVLLGGNTGGMLAFIGPWQAIVGVTAFGGFMYLHHRGRTRESTIAAGAVLGVGGLVSTIAAFAAYLDGAGPAGRYDVLTALRLAVATAAWVSVACVGVVTEGSRRSATRSHQRGAT